MAVRRKKVAVIHCNGRPTRKEGFEQVTVTGNYQELLTQYSEGINICSYGCLGGGSCVEACRLHAVSIGERGIAKIDEEKCVGCGKCAESCPAHVIKIENRKAKFRRKGCISCFCCQEMCPMKAISVKKAL